MTYFFSTSHSVWIMLYIYIYICVYMCVCVCVLYEQARHLRIKYYWMKNNYIHTHIYKKIALTDLIRCHTLLATELRSAYFEQVGCCNKCLSSVSNSIFLTYDERCSIVSTEGPNISSHRCLRRCMPAWRRGRCAFSCGMSWLD